MIKLIGFGPAFGVADPSPFVVKVDLLLRMCNIPYEYVADPGALRRAPKGKLPLIEDQGTTIPDSYFIFEYLRDRNLLNIDDHLTPEQRGIAHLVTKSLDENFYWTLVYSRWMRDDTWPTIRKTIFGKMPLPLRWIVPGIVRNGTRKTLHKHGIGRHNEAEIMQIFEHSLQSLSEMLSEKAYFFGDKPSSLDATAFAFLSSLILVTIDNPFNAMARSYPNLVAFCQRNQQRYYAETKSGSSVASVN